MRRERRLRRLTVYALLARAFRAPPDLFWPALALAGVVTVLATSAIRGAPVFGLGLAVMAFVVGVVPVIVLKLADMFEDLARAFSPILVPEEDAADAWLDREGERMFSWKEQWRTTAVLMPVLGAAYFWLGAPFRDPLANAASWALIVPVALVVANGTHILFAILRFQARLTAQPVLVKMLDSAHRPLYELNRYAHFVTLSVLAAYVLLYGTVTLEPWPESPIIDWTLAIFAFYPLASYSWSVLQVHHLQREVKHQHLDHLAHDVDRAYRAFREDPTPGNAERLKHLLAVQEGVRRTTDWPVSFQTVATFALTAATPAVVQLLLRLWE